MSDLTGLLLLTAKTLRRTTATSTVSAFGTEAWTDHLTGLACAIQPLTSRELTDYGRVWPEATHHLYVAGAPDILARDRVQITAGDTYWQGSAPFEILGPGAGQGGLIECSRFVLQHLEDV